MHRVYDVEQSLGIFNDDIVPADEDKLGMWREVFLPIRRADDERPRAPELLANQISVHTLLIRRQSVLVKPASRRDD